MATLSDEERKEIEKVINSPEACEAFTYINSLVDKALKKLEPIKKRGIEEEELYDKLSDYKTFTLKQNRLIRGIWMGYRYDEIEQAFYHCPSYCSSSSLQDYFTGKGNKIGVALLMNKVIAILSNDCLEESINSKKLDKDKFRTTIEEFKSKEEERERGKTFESQDNNIENCDLDSIRDKWNRAFKGRCQNINILGISRDERTKGNIDHLWQKICLKCESEILNICKDDVSIGGLMHTSTSEQKSKKIIVHGDQGLGKTSLLKLLAIKCSEEKLLKDCIPFFVSMPRIYDRFGKQIHEIDSDDLYECIAKWITDKSNITLAELEALVSEGRVLFLLDRIDFNDEIFRVVREFVIQFENNNFVLTSNRQIDNLNGFKSFEIKGFEGINESKSAFVENWFQNHNTSNGDEKNKEYLQQIVTSDSIYSNLANSPLLLQFLCLASLKNNLAYKIESNKLSLYQDALFSLIKEKDRDSGFDPEDKFYEKLKPFERVDLISYIAFEMFYGHHVFIGIEELGKFAQEYYFRYQHNQIDLFQAEAVIRSIEIQDGLLVNRLEKYAFSHITIQEFFASWYISQNPSKWEGWTTLHIDDRRWQKIFDQAEQILEINLNRLKKLRVMS
jgi:hypothetical protein